ATPETPATAGAGVPGYCTATSTNASSETAVDSRPSPHVAAGAGRSTGPSLLSTARSAGTRCTAETSAASGSSRASESRAMTEALSADASGAASGTTTASRVVARVTTAAPS